MQLTARSLHDGWTVRAASGPVPAQVAASLPAPAEVPGCVHLDLMRAGLIPDPYLDDNEALLAWIGLVDWEYRTTFEMDAAALASASVHDLVFDGLDTVAEVRLNGGVVARTANQHRGYRFDVTALLREGENELVVAFTSPIRYANAQSVALGARPRPYPLPYDAIRKSSSHRRPTPGYTLNCEEPLKPEALTCERGPLLTFAAGEMVLRPPGPDREVIVQHRVTEHRLRRGALCARSGESWCA